MTSTLRIGPVLLFRGLEQDALHLCALTVTDSKAAPGDLQTAAGERFAPARLLENEGRVLWRTPFSLPITSAAQVSYRIAGQQHNVAIPPDTAGPRLLFTACNGTEDPEDIPKHLDRMRLWRLIREAHQRQPFHLLIQGGDQVYADPIWDVHPRLQPLRSKRYKAARIAFDEAMDKAVRRFFFDLYLETWRHPEVAGLLASVPSVMMWDDHDIFDGWGSWPPELQGCAVYQGLFRAARDAFASFQLGVRLDEPLPSAFLDPAARHFGWVYRLNELAIWAPDLRSQRTQAQVMGDEHGQGDIEAALRQARGCRHLFVVSSVPVLNIPMRPLERLHFAIPGHQYFQDDLRDQWQSYVHALEWERFVDSLLRFKSETDARVTLLSGEIHLGAWGVLEAPEGHIHQLTSSGVVHPPPPQWAVRIMDWVAHRQHWIGQRARFQMRPVPGFGRRYLAQRNWLMLEPAPTEQTYRAQWRAETGPGESLLLD